MFSLLDIKAKNMATKGTFCCCMSLQAGSMMIGVLDLLVLAAVYNSQYAYRIDPSVAIICIAPSVLLVIGATVKNRHLMWPWLIAHVFVQIGLLIACVLMVIGAFSRDVGMERVVWRIDEIIFDRTQVESLASDLFRDIVHGDRALQERIIGKFCVYLGTVFALFVVCAIRTSGVKRYVFALFHENQNQRIQNALPMPNSAGYTQFGVGTGI